VLRSNYGWAKKNALGNDVTLLAFDAKAMPFRDKSMPAVVSNLGFPNIRNDGKAAEEAFRVLVSSGILITNFMFTAKETENYAKAKEYGLDQFYARENVEGIFRKVGFKFSIQELHRGLVRPTPGGIDLFPTVQDVYSFCVIKATKP
jgi:ubiquinone/menaquinone biosynthesis C-methylase UbiE